MRCRPTDATSFPATDHLQVLMTPGWHTRIAKLTRNSRAPNASTVWRIANPALRPLFSPPMIHYRETTFVEIIWEITLPRFARHPSRLLEEPGRERPLVVTGMFFPAFYDLSGDMGNSHSDLSSISESAIESQAASVFPAV